MIKRRFGVAHLCTANRFIYNLFYQIDRAIETREYTSGC